MELVKNTLGLPVIQAENLSITQKSTILVKFRFDDQKKVRTFSW